MLEGLVAWVLNTYLGKYVNNLNTDQLSVALLKGAVELENLPLKKDALKELELPFEVKAGFVGKVTLQIPFYRPHVDPWVISISSLHLIGAPEKIQDFNDEKEKQLERERKKALLQALEEKWKSERQQKGESYWYSVTASVVTRIVENIEVSPLTFTRYTRGQCLGLHGVVLVPVGGRGLAAPVCPVVGWAKGRT